MAPDNNPYQDIDLACRKLIFGNNKVCGLTDAKYATAAANVGARFGGLIFAEKSPRFVTKAQAQNIIQAMPKLEYVGVFVNHNRSDIIDLVKTLQLRAVQLHGSEDEQYIEALTLELAQNDCDFCQIWQASPVAMSVPLLSNNVSQHVLDGQSPGSGKAFDWQVLALSEQDLSSSFLAGGLNSDNINQAIEQLTHSDLFGLDLNSGVESSPGIKSSEKLSQVFSQIRNY